MKHFSNEKTICDFSTTDSFIGVVESEETFLVETKDCFGNQIKAENQVLSSLSWDSINPCTGPIMIKNAHIGEVLKIEIINIELGTQGIIIKDHGDLQRFHIEEPEKSILVEIQDNKRINYRGKSFDVKPMIGVIGVLTEENQLTTLPGINGGNMDNSSITIGSTVYLPVLREGAGLAIGDLHASMGDGETTGCGIETNGIVKIKVTVITEKHLPLPFVETKEKYITVTSADTLDKAADMAASNMNEFLIKSKHLNSDEAWIIMTMYSDIRVCQVANRLKTARCEIKRNLL